MEHHSDLLPWQMVCRQTGAELKFLECEKDGSLDLNKAEELITDRTKIVAVTQLSNVLGREYPIESLQKLHTARTLLWWQTAHRARRILRWT